MTAGYREGQKPIRTPVAEQVAGLLKAEIARLKPGDRLPGMHELRRRYEVSINTVGMALALLQQEGVVVRRNGNGVFVADRAPRRIGILSELDLFDSRISPQWRSLAGALKSSLEAAGHISQVYIGNAEPGPGASDEPTCPRFWEDAAAGRLDGAVIIDLPSNDAWYTRVRGCPIPVVGAMTPYTVTHDVAAITREAVARLAAQGCRRLGFIAWHGEAAFVEAVKNHGLTPCDAWVRADLDPASRGSGWEEFREIWSAPEKPDGLVILDDMLFADAQLALFEMGVRVPEQVRLAVATSRNASPPTRVPLTAFESDPAELAAELVALLRQRLAGELTAPVTRYLPFREVAVQPAEERPVISDL
jgi:DNA-binding LacI/PurR family transcriptional regulator